MKKSWKQIAFPGFRLAQGGEHGVTLIETLVALAILAAVAVIFLSGLTTSSKAVMVSQERVAAESLAKSQMEYIKNQDYDEEEPLEYNELADIPAGYDIEINAVRIDSEGNESEDDLGLQEITVTVNRNGDTLLTLVDYKVNR